MTHVDKCVIKTEKINGSFVKTESFLNVAKVSMADDDKKSFK